MRKILCMMVAVMALVGALASCSQQGGDPLSLAKTMDEADYEVSVYVDQDYLKEFAENWEIRSKGIEYIVCVYRDSQKKSGVFFYCSDKETAERMVKDLEDHADKEDLQDKYTRFMIERKGTLVFFGCEDAWEDAQ